MEKIKRKQYLIAAGNSTLLIWGCPLAAKKSLISNYLGEVEQIGFVETKNGLPFLNMMGGELCINGTLALASVSGRTGELYTSGLENPVKFYNKKDSTTIVLSLNFRQDKNLIILDGIGFIYLKNEQQSLKAKLKKLAERYNLPAFGALLYQDKRLTPYVYVLATNSLVKETACGSGSISLNILLGIEEIIQPTGKTITVRRKGNQFFITATVNQMKGGE